MPHSGSEPAIKRALISVSDKTHLVKFASALHQRGVVILSTGGTARSLRAENIPVTDVSDHTGFPEIMAGRVKTLHPKIHGGILARRGVDEAIMRDHDIDAIDLLVVNLYPFQKTVAATDCPLELAIENIDIGGPAMIRAAAKNHDAVSVVVDPEDYDRIINDMSENGSTTRQTRFELACKAFAHTADYDGAIANYLSKQTNDGQSLAFPKTWSCQLEKVQDLRYGENPHQRAAFFVENNANEGSIAKATQHQGKPLSFNNIADADAALECVKQFNDEPCCVIVKHANPCGIALGDSQENAYQRAFEVDSTSAFGGIIAFNHRLKTSTAKAILRQQFVEVIIAPDIEAGVMEVLADKTNIRLLTVGQWTNESSTLDIKRVNGGLLLQDSDTKTITKKQLKVVTDRTPHADEINDLMFAWQVAKYVKSNAIVYALKGQTLGIGAGQMSRIVSARIAEIKAKDAQLNLPGAVMASDAFFPFRDGIDAAHQAGIRAIIQPGGSMRDDEVIAAANEHDIAMVFTGIRHFRH